MKKFRNNAYGFSAVELLLIFIILAIIGFAGWYVYNAKNNTNKTLKNTSQGQGEATKTEKKVTSKPGAVDPTTDWIAYSNADGQYNLKHPKSWVKAAAPELCNPGLLLIGGDAKSVGHCASESFGQMGIDSQKGDNSANQALSNGYINITKTDVTVEGVKGVKYTGTASGQQNGEALGGYNDGTKVVKYVFFTNARTYTASYIQQSTYPDVLSDFDLMVTKTLKFAA